MKKEQKAQVIDELAEKLKQSGYFYIADASGLSVGEVNSFRGKCFEKGVEYKVYKNTMIVKALEKAEITNEEIKSVLKGFSGIMFTSEDGANLPAKVLKDFRKGSEKPVLKAAYLDSDLYVGDDQIESLTKLKSKSELIGEVISLLQSPAKNVVSALQSGGQTLSGIIKTLSEKSE